MLSGVGLCSVVISNNLGDCGTFFIKHSECCMRVCMYLCKPENHLRCCSSGNFYLGFCNLLSHWPRQEEQARLAGLVSSRALPVSASPGLVLQSVTLCLVLNLSSQTQVLMLSKQYLTD